MGWLSVDRGADSFVVSCDKNIQKGDLIIRLLFLGEFDCRVLLVDVVVQKLHLHGAILWTCRSQIFSFSSLMAMACCSRDIHGQIGDDW